MTARCVRGTTTHILARGPAARPRCIPPASGSDQGMSPSQSQQNVSPFNQSQGDFALLAPIDMRAFLPPRPQTTSWRRFHREQRAFLPYESDQEGSYRAALPWNLPIDQGCFTPLEPRPTVRRLDAASAPVPNPILRCVAAHVASKCQPSTTD